MKIFNYLRPPKNWIWPVNFFIAVLAGLTGYAFYVSNAVSYLSDDPETCVNCHVMQPEFATWQHSSHREVAVCNDCHVPHDNLLNKYSFKARDGMRHATIFTLRAEPQVIQIKEAGKSVVQENCIRCHQKPLEESPTLDATYRETLAGEGRICWDCHREVPHGTVRGLASVPHARVPLPGSPVPDWLKDFVNRNNN